MTFLCSSYKDSGRFLFWTWELWEIGGGGGVAWKFLGYDINPSEHNPLWMWFNFQRKLVKNEKANRTATPKSN